MSGADDGDDGVPSRLGPEVAVVVEVDRLGEGDLSKDATLELGPPVGGGPDWAHEHGVDVVVLGLLEGGSDERPRWVDVGVAEGGPRMSKAVDAQSIGIWSLREVWRQLMMASTGKEVHVGCEV